MLIAAKPVAVNSKSFVLGQMQLALLTFDDDGRALLAALGLTFLMQFLFAQVIFDKLPNEVTDEQINRQSYQTHADTILPSNPVIADNTVP